MGEGERRFTAEARRGSQDQEALTLPSPRERGCGQVGAMFNARPLRHDFVVTPPPSPPDGPGEGIRRVCLLAGHGCTVPRRPRVHGSRPHLGKALTLPSPRGEGGRMGGDLAYWSVRLLPVGSRAAGPGDWEGAFAPFVAGLRRPTGRGFCSGGEGAAGAGFAAWRGITRRCPRRSVVSDGQFKLCP